MMAGEVARVIISMMLDNVQQGLCQVITILQLTPQEIQALITLAEELLIVVVLHNLLPQNQPVVLESLLAQKEVLHQR